VPLINVTPCYAIEKKQAKFKKSASYKARVQKKAKVPKNYWAGLDPTEIPEADTVFKYLGIPYIRGGTGKKGFDCSGLTQRLYSEIFGLALPHNSYQQSKLNILEEVPLEEDEFEPNDLLFFAYKSKRINHVGIYLADGKFLHASPKGGVKISNMQDPFWQRTLVASRRVKDTVLAKAAGTMAPKAIDGSDVFEDHEISVGYAAALDENLFVNLETFYSGRFTTQHVASAEPFDFYRKGPTQQAAMGHEFWQGIRISADIHPAQWLRITPSLGMLDGPSMADDINRNWQVYGLEAALSPLAYNWSLTLSVRSLLNESYYAAYENAPDTNMGLYFNYRVSDTMGLSVMGNWEGAYLMRETGADDLLRDVRDVSVNLNFSF
jgi:hypothetical protein